MRAWVFDEEVERGIIKRGEAAEFITDDFDRKMGWWGLYQLPREEVVEEIFSWLEYHVAYYTIWLAGILKIAAEETVSKGVSIRRHKRKLFKEIYASDEGRNRILNIAANHIYDVQYREDRSDIRRFGRIKGSKLTGQQASDIRFWRKYGTPKPSVSAIAREYGVTQKCIYNVLNGVTFKAAGSNSNRPLRTAGVRTDLR